MMNLKDSAAKLAQLRIETEDLIRQYNDAMQEKRFDDAVKLDNDMSEKIGEYTSTVRILCFEKCKNTDDPMLTAVKFLTYETIGVKDTTVGDEAKIPVRELIKRERPIDLLKLDKYCGGIGHDKTWNHMVMKMNFLLTVQKCIDLGVDPKKVYEDYAMSETARQFDMGKNPTSKTNLLKTLQKVITAMLGDGYKATSHDVNFLLSIYSKKSRKALTITTANHRYMRNYLAEICHRIATGATYGVEYKKAKDKKESPKETESAPFAVTESAPAEENKTVA